MRSIILSCCFILLILFACLHVYNQKTYNLNKQILSHPTKETATNANSSRWPPPNLPIRDPKEIAAERQMMATNSNITIQRSRLRHDKDYRFRVKRHAAIHAYTTSPLRDTPENQKFLKLLLSNGYDIEHWPLAIKVALRKQRTKHGLIKQWESDGYTDVEIEKLWKKSDSRQNSIRRGRDAMSRDVQIFDSELIEELLSIPIPIEVDGISEIDPITGTFVEGSMILTDKDWLNSELQLSQQSFTGERKTLQDVGEHIKKWTQWKMDKEIEPVMPTATLPNVP